MEPPTAEENVATIHTEEHSLSDLAVEISQDQLITQRNLNITNIDHFETLPSYSHIFEEYLMKNVPFILGKAATSSWKSRQDWLTDDGTPNFQFLRHNFGESIVPVANCREKKYSAQPKTDLTLCEYLQYWESYIHSGYSPSMENLYLKDWHFIRHFPQYEAYRTPAYFTSDWLNEFWDTQSDDDDYRFVYMGPKGSWTPFHADVLRSFSWSANICGRKKWILFPPGEEEKLKDRLGNLVYDVDSPLVMNSEKYPKFSTVKGRQVVIQEAGEIIYVPSGWHHQVYNMADTISVNHNWVNGCNIDISWAFLRRNLAEVQQEIHDCLGMDGWDTQCQMILKASSGTDFLDFYSFILTIAETRLTALKRRTEKSSLLNCSTKVCKPDTEDSMLDNVHTGNLAEWTEHRLVKCCEDSKEVNDMHAEDIVKVKDGTVHMVTIEAITEEFNKTHTEDYLVIVKDKSLCLNCSRIIMRCADDKEIKNMHTKDIAELKDRKMITRGAEEGNETHTEDLEKVKDKNLCLNCSRMVRLSADVKEIKNMHSKDIAESKDHKMIMHGAEEFNKTHTEDLEKVKDKSLCLNCCRMVRHGADRTVRQGADRTVRHGADRTVRHGADAAAEITNMNAEEKDVNLCKNCLRMSENFSSVLGNDQVLFDINRLKCVLVIMMKDPEFRGLDFSDFSTSPRDLLVKLQDAK